MKQLKYLSLELSGVPTSKLGQECFHGELRKPLKYTLLLSTQKSLPLRWEF